MNGDLDYSAITTTIIVLIGMIIICYVLGCSGLAVLLIMFTVMVIIWLCVVINCPHPESYNRWTKPTDRY